MVVNLRNGTAQKASLSVVASKNLAQDIVFRMQPIPANRETPLDVSLLADVAPVRGGVGAPQTTTINMFAIMAKMARKSMAKWREWRKPMAKMVNFFSPFRHGENREKNNKWRMAMSPHHHTFKGFLLHDSCNTTSLVSLS